MRLKSFSGPTHSDAMAAVRAELGDDVVIVAARDEPDGAVRITVAVDEPEDRRNGAGETTDSPPPPAWPDEQPVDVIYRAFRDHGLPVAVGEPLLDTVAGFETRDPLAALAAAIRQTFRFAPIENKPRRQPIMAVGSPGVGKTQTIAKLAARALIAGRKVEMISTDTERTGGVSQLRAFADALRLDLVLADKPAALADSLLSARDAELVLIDSVGRNHLDAADLDALAPFLLEDIVEPVLVLPAGIDSVEAGDIASAFRGLGARRLIATRLDMTRRIGSVLAAAYAAGLAFAEISTTAMIKDGLSPADPIALASLLLPTPPGHNRRVHTGTH